MGALFNIINYSIGNLFLGVFITILGVALMFFLIKSWFNHKTFTTLSFIIGAILFVFLSFQSILLCGAITIKTYTDEVEKNISEWVKNIPPSKEFDKEDSQIIMNGIMEEWPLVGYFVDTADFTGHTSLNIAPSMADAIREYMNWFILRRVLWSLFFTITGAVIVIKSMEGNSSRRRRSSYSSSSSRGRRRPYDY